MLCCRPLRCVLCNEWMWHGHRHGMGSWWCWVSVWDAGNLKKKKKLLPPKGSHTLSQSSSTSSLVVWQDLFFFFRLPFGVWYCVVLVGLMPISHFPWYWWCSHNLASTIPHTGITTWFSVTEELTSRASTKMPARNTALPLWIPRNARTARTEWINTKLKASAPRPPRPHPFSASGFCGSRGGSPDFAQRTRGGHARARAVRGKHEART